MQNIDEYAKKAAMLLKLLGSTHGDKGKFFSFAEVSNKNVDILNKSVEGDLFTAEELAAVHKLYDTVPERDTLIHGDFHTHNIFINNGELLLIDMADTSIGHPIFEIGNMYLPFMYLATQYSERAVPLLGLDSQTAVSFFNKTVDFYWRDIGSESIAQLMVLARILGHIRMMHCAMPKLRTLPAEIKTKHLLNYKDALKSMYFDRVDEILILMKKITALF